RLASFNPTKSIRTSAARKVTGALIGQRKRSKRSKAFSVCSRHPGRVSILKWTIPRLLIVCNTPLNSIPVSFPPPTALFRGRISFPAFRCIWNFASAISFSRNPIQQRNWFPSFCAVTRGPGRRVLNYLNSARPCRTAEERNLLRNFHEKYFLSCGGGGARRSPRRMLRDFNRAFCRGDFGGLG